MARQIRDPRSRARVIEVAWRVVAAHGVQGASVRTIAAEAKVSTGYITHYFTDKGELMAEVLRYNNARARARVIAAIGERRGLAAVQAAVDAVLPLDADRRREWQVWVASWGPASPGDELAAGLRGGWRYLDQLFSGLLEQAAEDGELREGLDPGYESERLLTMVAGTGLLAGVEPPAAVRRTAQRLLADQLALLGGAGQQHLIEATTARSA